MQESTREIQLQFCFIALFDTDFLFFCKTTKPLDFSDQQLLVLLVVG